MKRVALALILTTGLAAPASAQGADAGMLIERLRAADTNRDGAVSRQEFLEFRASQFAQFDRNHDGFLTADDRPRFMQRRGGDGAGAAQMMQAFDADGDGRVSEAEFTRGPTPAFDRVDANRDGVATEAEFSAALAALRASRAG